MGTDTGKDTRICFIFGLDAGTRMRRTGPTRMHADGLCGDETAKERVEFAPTTGCQAEAIPLASQLPRRSLSRVAERRHRRHSCRDRLGGAFPRCEHGGCVPFDAVRPELSHEIALLQRA